MSGNKKIEEGLEHVKNAEKSLKTSLLKWRPDHENAADEYSKAATCFRNAKAFEQCKDCLLKTVECHKQNRALFYAAKALDQCVLVCKELGDFSEIASLAERAANMFQNHGSAESAAASLDKAAKILESQRPADALRLYQRAAEIALIQDNSRQAAEYTSKVARLHVKLQQYDLAADALRRELGLHQQSESYQATGRLAVALVLVQLARGDVVAAEKAFKEWGNYCDPPEVQTLETLLQAYDEEDPENAKRALNSPFIKHMDVEYAILARDMPLPRGLDVPSKVPVRENTADEYVSSKNKSTCEEADGAPGDAEDDDYAGGLC
ncbi:gamma-soluble NSF attachment protein-like [Cylas formicarius]|uniref:gamma-soluble NSF attachment protein-like n=1 Tax=Cylas formicarius TaxID=197179 RepID=UPI002958B050|nr:gamma-soluble NSF attachment protein-like [Cylas formicarius]